MHGLGNRKIRRLSALRTGLRKFKWTPRQITPDEPADEKIRLKQTVFTELQYD
jgi:hypothetical protein